MKNKSIVNSLSLKLVLLIIFFGSLATFFVYSISLRRFTEQAKTNIATESTVQAKRVDSRLRFAININETLASQEFAKEAAHSNEVMSDNMAEIHLRHYLIGDYYQAIYIMNKDGLTVLSTDENFLGRNYGFREYFKTAIKGDNYVDSAVGITSNELGYYISTPIISKNEIIGVSVTKLDPKYVSEILDIHKEGEGFFFADKYGVVIETNKKEEMYKTLGNVSAEEIKTLNNSRRYGGNKIQSLSYNEAQLTLGSLKETIVYDIFDNTHGKEELVAISPILNNDFFLMVEIEKEKVINESIELSMLLASFVFVSAFLVVALVFYGVKNSFKPLKEIIESTDQISNGNYETKINYNKDDEFGKISTSINQMTRSIKESKDEMEKKVEERTKRLEKINKSMVGRELKMIELKNKILFLEKADNEKRN